MELHHPPECSSYRELSSFSRHKTTPLGEGVRAACGGTSCCDRSGYSSTSPDWAGPAWYRFTGQAGTQMPDSPPAVNQCGASVPGWLAGGHPGPGEQVSRTVNFHWSGNTALWSVGVSVTHCPGGYYVYRLPEPPQCSLTYCGE